MSLQMKYFVLKPHGTDMHAAASRAAMLTYAKIIEGVDRELAEELCAWVHREAMDFFREKPE